MNEGGDEKLRLAFGQGLWGGRLPDDWQVIDAGMYAVLAYLRRWQRRRMRRTEDDVFFDWVKRCSQKNTTADPVHSPVHTYI